MFNPGSSNCNGSQFMITYPRVEPEVLDGSHVAFGQVVEGWNVLMALEQLGDARQEGLTFQRITLEQCGVLRYGKDGVGGAAPVASVSVEASASAGRCGRGRRGGKASASAGKKVSSAARFGSAGARALAARFAYA
jgi:cyclophilin family peptidyl-prolyl cis-trans isomerase